MRFILIVYFLYLFSIINGHESKIIFKIKLYYNDNEIEH